MDSDSFLTISAPAEAIYKDRGSKFLSYCFPIQSASDSQEILEKLKGLHPKANHICYAYQIGYDSPVMKNSDDGEPSGSAGMPIQNAIRSQKVTDLIVAVVRYFGGTKLGIRGLIDAYRLSSENVLKSAKVVKKYHMERHKLIVHMNKAGMIMSTIKQLNLNIESSSYGKDARIVVGIRRSKVKEVLRSLLSAAHGIKAQDLSEDFVSDIIRFEAL